MRHLHQQNLAAAAEAKAKAQEEQMQAMRYAGNELARVIDDITNSELCQLDQISRAVVIATIAKWNRAKTGQL
jgi:flagellar biosynthesis regulator FlaF